MLNTMKIEFKFIIELKYIIISRIKRLFVSTICSNSIEKINRFHALYIGLLKIMQGDLSFFASTFFNILNVSSTLNI